MALAAVSVPMNAHDLHHYRVYSLPWVNSDDHHQNVDLTTTAPATQSAHHALYSVSSSPESSDIYPNYISPAQLTRTEIDTDMYAASSHGQARGHGERTVTAPSTVSVPSLQYLLRPMAQHQQFDQQSTFPGSFEMANRDLTHGPSNSQYASTVSTQSQAHPSKPDSTSASSSCSIFEYSALPNAHLPTSVSPESVDAHTKSAYSDSTLSPALADGSAMTPSLTASLSLSPPSLATSIVRSHARTASSPRIRERERVYTQAQTQIQHGYSNASRSAARLRAQSLIQANTHGNYHNGAHGLSAHAHNMRLSGSTGSTMQIGIHGYGYGSGSSHNDHSHGNFASPGSPGSCTVNASSQSYGTLGKGDNSGQKIRKDGVKSDPEEHDLSARFILENPAYGDDGTSYDHGHCHSSGRRKGKHSSRARTRVRGQVSRSVSPINTGSGRTSSTRQKHNTQARRSGGKHDGKDGVVESGEGYYAFSNTASSPRPSHSRSLRSMSRSRSSSRSRSCSLSDICSRSRSCSRSPPPQTGGGSHRRHCHHHHRQSQEPAPGLGSALQPHSLTAPLRAVNASKEMRALMGVFRLDPFTSLNGVSVKGASGGDGLGGSRSGQPTWDGGEAGPLESEPVILEFQLYIEGMMDENEDRASGAGDTGLAGVTGEMDLGVGDGGSYDRFVEDGAAIGAQDTSHGLDNYGSGGSLSSDALQLPLTSGLQLPTPMQLPMLTPLQQLSLPLDIPVSLPPIPFTLEDRGERQSDGEDHEQSRCDVGAGARSGVTSRILAARGVTKSGGGGGGITSTSITSITSSRGDNIEIGSMDMGGGNSSRNPFDMEVGLAASTGAHVTNTRGNAHRATVASMTAASGVSVITAAFQQSQAQDFGRPGSGSEGSASPAVSRALSIFDRRLEQQRLEKRFSSDLDPALSQEQYRNMGSTTKSAVLSQTQSISALGQNQIQARQLRQQKHQFGNGLGDATLQQRLRTPIAPRSANMTSSAPSSSFYSSAQSPTLMYPTIPQQTQTQFTPTPASIVAGLHGIQTLDLSAGMGAAVGSHAGFTSAAGASSGTRSSYSLSGALGGSPSDAGIGRS